jgi:hypothetical protein
MADWIAAVTEHAMYTLPWGEPRGDTIDFFLSHPTWPIIAGNLWLRGPGTYALSREFRPQSTRRSPKNQRGKTGIHHCWRSKLSSTRFNMFTSTEGLCFALENFGLHVLVSPSGCGLASSSLVFKILQETRAVPATVSSSVSAAPTLQASTRHESP